MPLDVSSVVATALISIIACAGTLFIVARKWLVPVLLAVVDEKLVETNQMMKAAASSMGKASVESRNLKKMEKMVVGDILGEYPEINMILEMFSPETAEMIEENPEMAMKLLMRYKPILDAFMANKGQVQEEPFML